ncbi:hypothetical protein EIP86_000695 [Pleurotus ostreatoroseus]|nr:hypothetical protein EIP86_000695 [Pleurotus ostreatoroseus]
MASPYPAYDPRAGTSNPYSQSRPYLPREPSSDSDASENATALPYKPPELDKAPDVRVDVRAIMRTPSPTPSEVVALNKKGLVDWQAMKKRSYWFRREWLWYYVIITIVSVGTILFTVYHKQIVQWIQPTANKVHDLPAGWLIPIGILFVISFPPLFGHEIIAILCGVVWGLGIGFAIVAAGTFIGEVGNFYAFKHCCSARGEKMEKKKLQYACLARVVREGGFKIALIARYSAIPGHFTTAVFSTCGMNIWVFMAAAFLSLPKQFITVYLGVALEDSEKGSSKSDTIIKDVVLVITAAITFIAMWYIYHLMNKVKTQVIYDRRKARQAKMLADAGVSPTAILQTQPSVPYNQDVSEAELPLTANFNAPGFAPQQQWDGAGRAVGYAPDPQLYAPRPQRPPRVPTPGEQRGSNDATPVMSERDRGDGRAPPSRQNTAGSAASWDVRAHVGPDAYRMTSAAPSLPPQPQAQGAYRDPYAGQVQNMAGVGTRSRSQSRSRGGSARASPVPARIPPPPASQSVQQLHHQQQQAQQGQQQQQTYGQPPVYTREPSPLSAPSQTQGQGVGQAQYATYAPPAGPPPAEGAQSPLPNPYTPNSAPPLPNPYTPTSAPPLPSYQNQQQQGPHDAYSAR